MNFQKLTLKSQEAVQLAQEIAMNYSNQSIEPIHLLAALIQDPNGLVPEIIQKIGTNINYIKIKVNEGLESQPKVSNVNSDDDIMLYHKKNIIIIQKGNLKKLNLNNLLMIYVILIKLKNII